MLLWKTLNFQSFPGKDLKTCRKKIENKSYHHRRILRPILEDGNVNKVSFEIIFKRSESMCLVLKPVKHEQKRLPYAVFDVSSICSSIISIFVFIREPLPILAQRDVYQNSMKIPVPHLAK